MREKVVKTAENLNNLLKSEVSAIETQNDECKSLYTDYIFVMHHEMMIDEESREEIFSNVEDEMAMVWAYLKKTLIFGVTDDELLLRTSFFEYGGGTVGFSVRVGNYYH